MSTNLSKYIKQERLRQGFNAAQLSEIMGYRNINKGMRRIVELEREGKADPEILRKVVTALNLDQGYIDKLIKEDQAEYKKEFGRWVNEPVKMSYTIRVMPTIYLSYDLPANIKTEDEAIEYAKSVAIEHKSIVWLVLSRKENIHFDSNGTIISKNEVTLDNSWLPATVVR